MLYMIREELAHRTISRLFGAYDVVIVDTVLERSAPDAPLPFSPQGTLRKVVQSVANTSGLNVVPFAPNDDGISPDDGPMALHVLAGLHALDDTTTERMNSWIGHYSSIKQASAQRLLVLTDSVFIKDEPYDWAANPRVAVVFIEGS